MGTLTAGVCIALGEQMGYNSRNSRKIERETKEPERQKRLKNKNQKVEKFQNNKIITNNKII